MRNLPHALIALLVLLTQFSCGPTHVVVESSAPPPQAPPPDVAPPPAEASYQSFYDALSPYGEWINDPEYGYVWMPNVGPDFKPYATNGNWVYTEDGWTWASNYSWGWAPFHYGRWFYEEGYGWMWMPGNEWAPAWVAWRQGPQYYGWAPLGPSVNINVAEGGGYNPPAHYWCFVPQQYVTSPHVTNYYVNEQQNVTIINNTTIIHNTVIVNNRVNNTRVNHYAGGPDPGEVSRTTGVQLRPITVRESNTPGENHTGGAYAIYRPRINAAPQGNGGMAAHPAPSHVQTINNVRPANTTIYTNTGRYNNNRGSYNSAGSTPDNNTRSTVQPYSSRPSNPPAGQPVAEPGRQQGFQPGNRQGNQAGGQSAAPQGNQPGNQVGNPPGGQPDAQPGQPQGGFRPGEIRNGTRTPGNAGVGNGNGYGNASNGNVNNGNGNNGNRNHANGNGYNANANSANANNANANNANGNNSNGNNRPKPSPNQNPGRSSGQRNSAGNGNSNGRPGQPNSNANGPKPRPSQGQGSSDNHQKPDHNDPQQRP